jgi:hypothetical protein
MPVRSLLCRELSALPLALGLLCLLILAPGAPINAVVMTHDPKGFHGIPWGTPLDDRPDLVLVNSTQHIKEYELKAGPLPLGTAQVETMRLSTIDGQFARVTIHYQGQEVHERILAYLQEQYGPLDRTPGQTMRSFNQQYNWRGTDTEVNLTYQGHNERGVLFIESTVLAPRFNDTIPEHAY